MLNFIDIKIFLEKEIYFSFMHSPFMYLQHPYYFSPTCFGFYPPTRTWVLSTAPISLYGLSCEFSQTAWLSKFKIFLNKYLVNSITGWNLLWHACKAKTIKMVTFPWVTFIRFVVRSSIGTNNNDHAIFKCFGVQ